MNAPSSERRARLLLALGVGAGVAAAAVGLIRSGRAPVGLPPGVVALVNGEPITAEAFSQLEAAVTSERRGAPLDDAQRQRILDRLVDEELLLQRGIELGMPRHEPNARRAIVSALVATIASDAEASEPSEETLRRFHAETPERFQRPGRVTAEVLFESTSARPEAQAFQRAADGARRLRAGEPFAAVNGSVGDPMLAPLPEGPLPLDTLRQYLGPSPAEAASRLAPGEVSDPVRGAAGYYVVQLLARAGGEPAPFEAVRDQVRTEWLRTQGERALQEYLHGLRAQGNVLERLPAPGAAPEGPPARAPAAGTGS